MIDIGTLSIVLRFLVYVGAIAAAGAVLFTISFPEASNIVRSTLQWQIVVGCCLLFIAEPLRYAVFQLAISDGAWSVAFGPDLRWMGMQTPIGQAAAIRLIAAAVLVIGGWRSTAIGVPAALVMIGSFLLEGHTSSSALRVATAALLFIHLSAVCWWLGALIPLMALTKRAVPEILAGVVEAFGARAIWIVGGLLAAGVLLLVLITGGELRIASAYQQKFLIKIFLVAALLSIAARNKLRLTPLLRQEPKSGAARLRASIRLEIVVAVSILAVTAWIISSAPDD